VRVTATDVADDVLSYADFGAPTQIVAVNRGPNDCYVAFDEDVTVDDGALVKVDDYFSRTLRSKHSRVSAVCPSTQTAVLHVLADEV
jgi:hypothetical protein